MKPFSKKITGTKIVKRKIFYNLPSLIKIDCDQFSGPLPHPQHPSSFPFSLCATLALPGLNRIEQEGTRKEAMNNHKFNHKLLIGLIHSRINSKNSLILC